MSKAAWRKSKEVEKRQLSMSSEESEQRDFKTARSNNLDPITQALGEIGYFNNMRWQWFKENINGVMYPLEVSRFYKVRKLAIDIGNISEIDQSKKKPLLKENGIEYLVAKDTTEVLNWLRGIQ